MRILVVDDDPLGSRMVQFLLTEQGYTVEMADSARGALALLKERTPDLILLDVNMPHQSGFDFCRRLRSDGYEMPVIFVTAKGELEDRLQGLRIGADDYICKPFQPAELTARVEAVLRRYRRTKGDSATIQANGIEIDAVALRVNLPGRRPVSLTPTEMKVLVQLAQRPGETVEREEVMASVWGDAYIGESNIVDVYVRRLRRKLERDPAHPQLIHSARGIGYKFVG
ncbi:MAG TPA: response regulator transcription factor [Ktedonobacterales bacterium]